MISLHIGGGGIRATFVSHCLQNLFTNSKDMIKIIDEVSGVSAGSIVATCVATDTSLNETIEFLNQPLLPQPLSYINLCSELQQVPRALVWSFSIILLANLDSWRCGKVAFMFILMSLFLLPVVFFCLGLL